MVGRRDAEHQDLKDYCRDFGFYKTEVKCEDTGEF